MYLQSSKIPLDEHHSVTDVPVVYVIPVVSQEPVVSHPPVILYVLTHITGFPLSPFNLIDIAFDTPSYKGSSSPVVPLTGQLQLQLQLQFVLVVADC